MKKMIALISALAVLMIAFSGCVGDNKPAVNGTESNNSGANVNPVQSVANISKLGNLSGFEYIGSVPLNENDIKGNYNAENISGIIGGSEALYKHNETDFHVDVIELKDTEAANNLITTYKYSFPPLNNVSRFKDESFNGHSVVKITDYDISGGKTVPRYSYIWNNENYVIVVFGNTDDESLVKQLAEATGY